MRLSYTKILALLPLPLTVVPHKSEGGKSGRAKMVIEHIYLVVFHYTLGIHICFVGVISEK